MNPPQNYHFHYPNNFPDFTPDIPQLSNDEKQRNVWNWLEEHEDHVSGKRRNLEVDDCEYKWFSLEFKNYENGKKLKKFIF